jgi:hypothetical protein
MSFWGFSFLDQGDDILRLDPVTVDDLVPGGPSTSSWRLDADGGVYYARASVSGGAFIKQYDWVLPNSSASKYSVLWSTGTGTVDTTPGAADTDLPLSTDRTWTETNPTTSESASFTARIRLTGGSTDLITAAITLSVDGSP